MPADHIVTVLDEVEAAKQAVALGGRTDLVVLFVDKPELIHEVLTGKRG
jgi:hypothetical protein